MNSRINNYLDLQEQEQAKSKNLMPEQNSQPQGYNQMNFINSNVNMNMNINFNSTNLYFGGN